MADSALRRGFAVIAAFSSLALVEHGSIVHSEDYQLGAPSTADGKATVAAATDISEQALHTVRRATGVGLALIPASARRAIPATLAA